MSKQPNLISRREVLRRLYLTGAAVSTPGLLTACFSDGSSDGNNTDVVRGTDELTIPSGRLANISPLQEVDSNGVMLPTGFTSRIVARNSDADLAAISSTGYSWHPFPDGGATYPRKDGSGGWIYTSNSEVTVPLQGGCGAIVFDADGTIADAYSILDFTTMNCAGGKTPWDTWVSCEEHPIGMCWECDPYAPGQGTAKPSLGRFFHEAIAVDPKHNVIYLTEDAEDGRFYRWVADPSDIDAMTGRMAMENGTLQCINLAGYEDGGYEADDAKLRKLMPVTWADVQNPLQPQALNRGPGTVFNGGEGLWYYELPPTIQSIPVGGTVPTRGVVFWTTKGDNRVWALDVENQLVELIFDNGQIEPAFGDVDNLTVSPGGDILVAEDGEGLRIMVVLPNKQSKTLVQLDPIAHAESEICGPAFSPDGSRLYFSSQRGPDFLGAPTGTTFEVTIPAEYIS